MEKKKLHLKIIISKPHAHLQIMTKKPVNFQKDYIKLQEELRTQGTNYLYTLIVFKTE